MLREGEDVNLVFAQDLSSKTSSEGDPVALTLVDDLKVGGVVVAKAGAHAVGEVTKASKSGMMGKAGDLLGPARLHQGGGYQDSAARDQG